MHRVNRAERLYFSLGAHCLRSWTNLRNRNGGSEKIRTSTTLVLSQFPLPIGILIQSWRIQQESHLRFRPPVSGSLTLTIPLQVATRRGTAAYLMSRMKSLLSLWMHMFSWHVLLGVCPCHSRTQVRVELKPRVGVKPNFHHASHRELKLVSRAGIEPASCGP